MTFNPDKVILKDLVAPKKCNVCAGELRPVDEVFMKDGEAAYEKFREEFKKGTGVEWKRSPNWTCTSCGMIYDKDFNNTGAIVEWFAAMKEYYGES